jgi:cation:H+ antiporter
MIENPWIWLIAALVLLTAGAELLVRGAASLALRMRLSPLFIGLTVVAFGTSSPELAASLAAAARGSGDIAVGNVVGSNIFNIAAILGVTALIRPIPVSMATLQRDLLIVVAVSVLPWIALATGGLLPRFVGVLFLGALGLYIYGALQVDRRLAEETGGVMPGHVPADAESAGRYRQLADVALVVVGLAALVIGARTFVGAAIDVARGAGLSELVIGLTIVAAGTSLPELLTSIVAAARGHSEIAIGNVLGSNIFNILGVLGACALVQPQAVPAPVLWFDTPVMVLLSLALLPFVRSGSRISRREGAVLLLAFVAYIAALTTGSTEG